MMMKKSLLAISAALIFLGTLSGMANATPWVGTANFGGTSFNNVREFDWDFGPAFDILNQTLSLSGIQLTRLVDIDGITLSENLSELQLGAYYKQNGLADDYFEITYNSVVIASGTFSEADSFLDFDSNTYDFVGTVTSFDSLYFSPGISGFNLIGSNTFGDEFFDGSSTFTESAPVPEPSTMTLAGLGLACLFRAVRRNRKN